MGATCSSQQHSVDEGTNLSRENNSGAKKNWACLSACSGLDSTAVDEQNLRAEAVDPIMYDLCRKSLHMTLRDEAAAAVAAPAAVKEGQEKEIAAPYVGQHHLLYKHQKDPEETVDTTPTTSPYTTRLIVRRRPVGQVEEGAHGTHLYAIRYPPDDAGGSKNRLAPNASDGSFQMQEQCPTSAVQKESKKQTKRDYEPPPLDLPKLQQHQQPAPIPTEALPDFFQPARTKSKISHRATITDWVTVSEEHNIYVVDVGLSPAQCDKIVAVTEQVCRGQYAAYTYAKQTLGCREFPILAETCAPPVQTVVEAILELPTKNSSNSQHLQLDDREPHLVKYDVTKKERQKLDMHTDKSEWTFLIGLSNGCGLDYDGGGTYFECLNATVHIQRGHALVFPGKLRHCGQRITRGLRYLLVGFLVDKASVVPNPQQKDSNVNDRSTNTSTAPVAANSQQDA